MSEIKLSAEKSKSKVIVYFLDGNTRTFYSFPNRDKIGTHVGINSLKAMLTGKFKGKYKTALIVDVATENQIHKFVDDIQIF